MPGGDRTGPLGNGPMTGRQMGYCAGYPVPGFRNGGFGLGRGFGRGFGFAGAYGRGFRFRNWSGYPDYSPNISDRNALENEIRVLKEQLSSLETQVEKLDKQG